VKLSVAIVCKNNEKTLPRVLESVRVVREMLAVRGFESEVVAYDSGSTDGTIGLLEAAGARVIRGPWLGHIASKQVVLEACAGEWRLHLDSDESLEAACAGSLAAFVCSPGGARGARVNRKVWYLGAWLEHVWQPEWRLRVVRGVDVAAGVARWGGINPHDKMELVGEAAAGAVVGHVVDLAGDVRHESFVDIADHLGKQVSLARISAESLHAAGRRGSRGRLLVSPPGAFLKQLVLRGGWRDGWRGWTAAASAGVAAAMKHAILIELSRREI
jgi:hypothetical protein